MNKKLVLLVLPLILTACSSSNKDKKEEIIDDGSHYINEDVTIDFLCMADSEYHDELQRIIDEFKEIEPHVKVNLYNPQGAGSYAMIEKTVIAGFFKEDYPDLVQCYPDNVVKYLAKGYAVNIDEYLNHKDYGLSAYDKEDYISSFIDEGKQYTVSGTYSLPFCKSTELLYYNADALLGLKLNGINNDKELDEEYLSDLTWEELFDNLCPALKDYNDSLPSEDKIMVDSPESALFTYDSDENLFITLANQYGYGYTSVNNGKPSIDFDNEGMKGVIKTFKEAKDNGYFKTRKSNDGNYVSYLFQNKKSLFTVASTAGLSYNFNYDEPFKIGISKIPYASGKEYSSINQGPSVCILDHFDDNHNRALASYLLWKHMTNEYNSSSWALATGYIGIRNSDYERDEYKDALVIKDDSNLYDVARANCLKTIAGITNDTFNTAVFRGSSNARTNVGLLVGECLNSTDLDNEIDEIFTRYSDDAKSYLV